MGKKGAFSNCHLHKEPGRDCLLLLLLLLGGGGTRTMGKKGAFSNCHLHKEPGRNCLLLLLLLLLGGGALALARERELGIIEGKKTGKRGGGLRIKHTALVR